MHEENYERFVANVFFICRKIDIGREKESFNLEKDKLTDEIIILI